MGCMELTWEATVQMDAASSVHQARIFLTLHQTQPGLKQTLTALMTAAKSPNLLCSMERMVKPEKSVNGWKTTIVTGLLKEKQTPAQQVAAFSQFLEKNRR